MSPAKGSLFPHAVCRVAGLPVSCLEGLRAARSFRLWEEIRGIDLGLEGSRARLVPMLFETIGGVQDADRRRLLLKLKRDVHNLRSLERGAVARLPSEGPEAATLGAELARYGELSKRRRATLRQLEASFEEELVCLRRRFQELVNDEDFRRGLQLSSRTLASRLSRYIRVAPQHPRAKDRQVERSLMRYLSRMVMKPTPFGTFCAVLAARTDGPSPPRFSGNPRPKTSHLRLNKSVYGRLLPVMLQRPAIRRELRVELNPTLRREGERWVFMTSQGGAEVFQRLARNPVLDLLRELLTREGAQPLASLTSRLGSHARVEASEDEAEAYVLKLLELGFLRFRVGIPEQEVDWDLPLRQLLEPLEDDRARTIVAFLRRLRGLADEFATAGVDRRRALLEAAVASVRETFEELDAPIPARDPALGQMPPFYEDSGGEAALSFSPGAAGRDLEDFVRRTLRLAGNRSEQANMRCFFDRFYSEGAVPLLRFYEDYYREHFKGHLERQRPAAARQEEGSEEGFGEEEQERPGLADGTESTSAPATEVRNYDPSNPFGLEVVARLQRARRQLESRLQELWREAPEAEEIALDPEDLDAVTGGLPPLTEPCRSVSVFAHLLDGWAGAGGAGLVAANYLMGFGKYFSRFLYLLPEEVRRDLAASNEGLTGELLAEICGDASFNANLHPPLLPWEVSYPTGESGAAEEQILSSELWVEPVPGDPHRLRLRRGRRGPEVVPVDLGFLNPRMRPPLFQLLSRFSPAAAFSLPLPEAPTSSPPAAEGEELRGGGAAGEGQAERGSPVQVRPRITYRRLVLARRRWQVFSGGLPRRRRGEGEAAYFLRVQRWRESVGLPPEVFVKVRVLPAAKAPESSAPGEPSAEPRPRQRVREHLYKPQYVDFANPLLLDVFSRLGEGLETFLAVFEECLPARRHLVRSDGEGYATELVLQLDFAEISEGRPGGGELPAEEAS